MDDKFGLDDTATNPFMTGSNPVQGNRVTGEPKIDLA
jgi:hypothetical protein